MLKIAKKPAYFIDNKKVTWRDVKRNVDTFARALELIGVKKEDKVPIYVGNSLEYIVAFLGIKNWCSVYLLIIF